MTNPPSNHSLPDNLTFYAPRDIALVVERSEQDVRHHCRLVFPDHDGHWKLKREQAEQVIAHMECFKRRRGGE